MPSARSSLKTQCRDDFKTKNVEMSGRSQHQ